MLSCPVCGSKEVRRSRRKTLFGFIARWRGLRRYRCRECDKSFYRPLPPMSRSEETASEENRSRSRSERAAERKKRRRRKVEFLVFIGMLVIFYAALRVFTKQ